MRLVWSFGSGPSTGGAGGLPPGFLPVAAVLAARGEFGLVLGPLTLVALARPRLDPRARLRELGQTLLAQGQLFAN